MGSGHSEDKEDGGVTDGEEGVQHARGRRKDVGEGHSDDSEDSDKSGDGDDEKDEDDGEQQNSGEEESAEVETGQKCNSSSREVSKVSQPRVK